ncbi:MAG: hypothetical protein E7437_06865 [Ruminococcaceae bacterium]|nr:hypothetical protein [Oscillospiraceae bacterium]
MKRLFASFLSVVMLFGICACGSEERTNADIARDFYKAHYTEDYTLARQIVHPDVEDYVCNILSNSHFGEMNADCKVELRYLGTADYSARKAIEKRYEQKDISLLIEEGEVYTATITLTFMDDDEIETYVDKERYDVIVAKIDGKWYAIPAMIDYEGYMDEKYGP